MKPKLQIPHFISGIGLGGWGILFGGREGNENEEERDNINNTLCCPAIFN